jgi:hypothetical protein
MCATWSLVTWPPPTTRAGDQQPYTLACAWGRGGGTWVRTAHVRSQNGRPTKWPGRCRCSPPIRSRHGLHRGMAPRRDRGPILARPVHGGGGQHGHLPPSAPCARGRTDRAAVPGAGEGRAPPSPLAIAEAADPWGACACVRVCVWGGACGRAPACALAVPGVGEGVQPCYPWSSGWPPADVRRGG